MVVTGNNLEDFIATHGAQIVVGDLAYFGKTLYTTPYSGNLSNSPSSTQKWVQPFAGLLKNNIYISLIMYENNGVDPENLKLRVSNGSISPTFGYPGITYTPGDPMD
jgi:hypothetical protein